MIGGEQQISAHIDFHTYGEQVLWPYAYTYTDVPADMTADDHAVFVTIAQELALLNGYTAEQASDLYIHDGAVFDWMYGAHGVFSFGFELYPIGSGGGGFYPPDEVIPSETARNREAVLLLAELADCPYRATCQDTAYCPPSSRALSIPGADLQAFWTLDQACGERLDSSGQGNHLDEYSAADLALGQISLAADLESGSNSYLSISDTMQSGLDITGSLTLFGWIKPETLNRSQVLSAKYGEEGNDRAFRLDLRSDNTMGFFVSPDGTWSNDYVLVVDPPLASHGKYVAFT